MMNAWRKRAAMLAASLSIAAGLAPLDALAHRAWLLPSATQLEGKAPWVTVDAAISENLFELDTMALKLDGLQVVGPDGAPVPAEGAATGHLRSSFDLHLEKPGTYRIAIVNDSVMASYREHGEMRRWRGTPEAFAREVPADAEELRSTQMHSRVETFVTVGAPTSIAAKRTGVGLEMVPLTHPNSLSPGREARFRLLLDGKPAAGLKVSVVPGGVRYRGVLNEMLAVTDADGVFTVAWPKPGMYWLNASYPPRGVHAASTQDQSQRPAPPARRVSYGATLEVLPF